MRRTDKTGAGKRVQKGNIWPLVICYRKFCTCKPRNDLEFDSFIGLNDNETRGFLYLFCSNDRYNERGIKFATRSITGGLLVFLIGFHMLQGDFSRVNHPSEKDKQASKAAALSVSVSPLAIPILAGPGTITTAMNFSAGGFVNMGVTIAVFAILCVITYLCFVFGEKFVAFIGTSALGAITRMMGLILAVIGTQMVLDGLHGAFVFTRTLPK